jgi:hypothetical protein
VTFTSHDPRRRFLAPRRADGTAVLSHKNHAVSAVVSSLLPDASEATIMLEDLRLATFTLYDPRRRSPAPHRYCALRRRLLRLVRGWPVQGTLSANPWLPCNGLPMAASRVPRGAVGEWMASWRPAGRSFHRLRGPSASCHWELLGVAATPPSLRLRRSFTLPPALSPTGGAVAGVPLLSCWRTT